MFGKWQLEMLSALLPRAVEVWGPKAKGGEGAGSQLLGTWWLVGLAICPHRQVAARPDIQPGRRMDT